MVVSRERWRFEARPSRVQDLNAFEGLLSRPTDGPIDDPVAIDGDFIVLDVAGEGGPSILRMITRAAAKRQVIGVARFTDPATREHLDGWGVETISCGLLDRNAAVWLPEVGNVVYMAGKRLWPGRSSGPATTSHSLGP